MNQQGWITTRRMGALTNASAGAAIRGAPQFRNEAPSVDDPLDCAGVKPWSGLAELERVGQRAPWLLAGGPGCRARGLRH